MGIVPPLIIPPQNKRGGYSSETIEKALHLIEVFNFQLRPAPYIQQMAKDVEAPRLLPMDSESGISLNQVLLSMGHEPVPNGGQSNRALLTLMKSIEGEIVERKKMQANCEDMLFAAADWRKE